MLQEKMLPQTVLISFEETGLNTTQINLKLPLWYGSGSLLKAIMEHVEVTILLSLGGWLSHGQSCHISYFYIKSFQKYYFIYTIILLTQILLS